MSQAPYHNKMQEKKVPYKYTFNKKYFDLQLLPVSERKKWCCIYLLCVCVCMCVYMGSTKQNHFHHHHHRHLKSCCLAKKKNTRNNCYITHIWSVVVTANCRKRTRSMNVSLNKKCTLIQLFIHFSFSMTTERNNVETNTK